VQIEAAQPLAEDAHSLRLLEPGLNLGSASCYAGTEAPGGLRVWTGSVGYTHQSRALPESPSKCRSRRTRASPSSACSPECARCWRRRLQLGQQGGPAQTQRPSRRRSSAAWPGLASMEWHGRRYSQGTPRHLGCVRPTGPARILMEQPAAVSHRRQRQSRRHVPRPRLRCRRRWSNELGMQCPISRAAPHGPEQCERQEPIRT
jgi:hypothetical protein